MERLTAILVEDDAATTVEYALMLSLILLVAFAAIRSFGLQTGGLWSGIVSALQALGFL
jgi:Flp pilus assembly pilin Flp